MTKNRIVIGIIVVGLAILAVTRLMRSGPGQPPLTEEVGFVLSITGEWVGPGGRPLTLGAAVTGGSVRRKGDPGSIVVAIGDDTFRSCEGECTSFELPPTLPKPIAGAQRLFATIKPLFAQNPDRFLPAIGEGPSLQDAVAKLDGTGVDISPVLAELPDGKASVTFQPRVFGAPSAKTLEWKAGSPALVDLTPGLYTVTTDPTAHAARLLVTRPGGLDYATVTWKHAAVIAGYLPPETQRVVQRAWLESLARWRS